MQLDVQSRMFTYETNKASAIKFVQTISPHIKSYTRLLSTSSAFEECSAAAEYSSKNFTHSYLSPEKENKVEESYLTKEINRNVSEEVKNLPESKHKDAMCVCQPIAWSLITSSCLSRGTCDTVRAHPYALIV